MKYLWSIVEIDKNDLYKRGIVITESNNNRDVLMIDSHEEMINHLKQFALQESISLANLVRDQKRTLFKKQGKRVLPGVTCHYDYLGNKILYDLYRKMSSVKRKIISIGNVGKLTVCQLKKKINYELSRINKYVNQHCDVNNHNRFGIKMNLILEECFDDITEKDLNMIYQELDQIIKNSIFIINNYFNDLDATKLDSLVNLKSYFKNNPIDYAAISVFENYIIEICRSVSSNASKIEKNNFQFYETALLKFLMKNNFEIAFNNNGDKVYYNIDNISPLARYTILQIIKQLSLVVNFNYQSYSKESVVNTIDEKMEDTIVTMKQKLKVSIKK